MKVDFTLSDRALVESAATMIGAALKKAASAARMVGHQDFPYTTDANALEAFLKRYKGKVGEKQTDVIRIDVPENECVIMRQGIILLLNKHQGTESTLQEELALTDPSLSDRLGDLRGLAMRFGGQPSIFDPKTADEKASMAAEIGLPGAAVGAPPAKRRLVHRKKKDDGRGKNHKRKK